MNPFALTLTREQRGWVAAFVLMLGFMARMLTVHSPLLDHHAWRQADGAMIARNWYRGTISPLYPQTDARGSRPEGYVASGLELHALLFAAAARLTGFASEVGRTVSALCFPVSALLLWGFLRVRYGDWHAIFGVFIYATGLPLVLYSERAIWNEPVLFLLSMAALRSAQACVTRRTAAAVIVLLASVALIAAVKPQWLIILLPLVALWVERDGTRALLRWEPWLVMMVAVASAAAAMWHMRALAGMPGATNFGAEDKLFNVEDMSTHYAYIVLRRLVKDTLGPIGLVAWLAGVVGATRRGRLVEVAALASFVVYLIVVSRGSRVHDYYQLVVAPGALVAIPEGLFMVAATIAVSLRAKLPASAGRVALVLAWSMCLYCFGRSISFHSWYEIDEDKRHVCDTLRPSLGPGDLVVFAEYNSPDLLYCLDHRGWLLSVSESTPARLASVAADGASVLVMPREGRRELPGDRQPILSTQGWLVYRLH